MSKKKEYNFDDQPFAIINNAYCFEKRVCAGDTLDVHLDICLSITHDCVVTFEALAVAKQAFYEALRQELDLQKNDASK